MSNQILPLINPLLPLPIVKQATGDSRTTIYRKIQKGLFTRPVKVSGDRSRWPQNEVVEINKAVISGKSEDQIKEIVIELEKLRGAV